METCFHLRSAIERQEAASAPKSMNVPSVTAEALRVPSFSLVVLPRFRRARGNAVLALDRGRAAVGVIGNLRYEGSDGGVLPLAVIGPSWAGFFPLVRDSPRDVLRAAFERGVYGLS
jgi:hypothetical protein